MNLERFVNRINEITEFLKPIYKVIGLNGRYVNFDEIQSEPTIYVLENAEYDRLFPTLTTGDNENFNVKKIDNAIIIAERNIADSDDEDKTINYIFGEENIKSVQKLINKSIIRKILLENLENEKIKKEKLLKQYEEDKQYYIKSIFDTCEKIRKIQATSNEDKIIKELEEKLDKEFENIINHPMTKNVKLKSDTLCIDTVDVYTVEHYTGRRYYIGQMSIEFGLKNASIKLKNYNNNRNGYWNDSPFPHTDNRGSCCLGTAEAQLIQFLTENLYYAAYITMLNYLQSGVDIDDCAGWYLCRWDEVDEKGNIIKEGHSPRNREYDGHGCYAHDEDDDYRECVNCNREYDIDEMYYCERCDEYVCNECVVEINEHYYCPDCANEISTTCDHCGERTNNNSIYEVDGKYYCEDCYEELFCTCEECGDVIRKNNSWEVDGKYYCEDCFEKTEFGERE